MERSGFVLLHKEKACMRPRYINGGNFVPDKILERCFEACKVYKKFVTNCGDQNSCDCWCMDESKGICEPKDDQGFSIYQVKHSK